MVNDKIGIGNSIIDKHIIIYSTKPRVELTDSELEEFITLLIEQSKKMGIKTNFDKSEYIKHAINNFIKN